MVQDNMQQQFVPGILNPTLIAFSENDTLYLETSINRQPKFSPTIRKLVMHWEFIIVGSSTPRLVEPNMALVTLVHLPESLEYLECRYCELDELPPLPASLKVLIVDNNNLKKLPTLPPTLEFLHCGRNELLELPELPPTLTYLHCGYNKLSNIPQLPNSLIRFLYYENPLVVEPIIPAHVKYINDD